MLIVAAHHAKGINWTTVGVILTALFTGGIVVVASLDFFANRPARLMANRRAELKELLGLRMEEALVLSHQGEATEADVDIWYGQVCALIHSALGKAELNMFMQHTPSDRTLQLAKEGQKVLARSWMHQEALTDIIRRLDGLHIQEDFKPRDFLSARVI